MGFFMYAPWNRAREYFSGYYLSSQLSQSVVCSGFFVGVGWGTNEGFNGT